MVLVKIYPRHKELLAILPSSGYATFLIILAFQTLPHTRLPSLALLSVFYPFWHSLLPVSLTLAVWRRSRISILLNLIALASFLMFYAPRFLPRPRITQVTTNTLQVMTFNLGYERGNPDSLSAAITAERADIVVVQEATLTTASALRQTLNETYEYVFPETDLADIMLFSYHPITTAEWFQPAGDGRAALHAIIVINSMPIHLFAVHPEPPGLAWLGQSWIPIGLYDESVAIQMQDVVARSVALLQPVIIVGDFNMHEHSPAYKTLTYTYQDAFVKAGRGFGFTFPYGLHMGRFSIPGPFVRLDYLFHSTHFTTHTARVACEGTSDHCYLITNLSLPLQETP